MKGQDLLVLYKLAASERDDWTYAELSRSLCMSASEVHAAVKRSEFCGLYNPLTRLPNRLALLEFSIHGLRYAFPARPGAVTEGLPTSFAAESLRDEVHFKEEVVPVMPLPGGPAQGVEIAPLYRSAPHAAQADPSLYQLLALVDALRTGRSRERRLAASALEGLLAHG